MNMLKDKHSYLKRKDRFSVNTRMIPEYVSTIDVTKYMKSLKDENERFTNFVKSQGTEKYKSMRNIYYNFNESLDIIDRDFIVDEIILNDGIYKLQRLILKNTGILLSDEDIVLNVRKFDYKNDTGIRLYFLKNKNDEMILILIDLYHLILVSSYRDSELDYNRRKNFNYDLRNIKNN